MFMKLYLFENQNLMLCLQRGRSQYLFQINNNHYKFIKKIVCQLSYFLVIRDRQNLHQVQSLIFNHGIAYNHSWKQDNQITCFLILNQPLQTRCSLLCLALGLNSSELSHTCHHLHAMYKQETFLFLFFLFLFFKKFFSPFLSLFNNFKGQCIFLKGSLG